MTAQMSQMSSSSHSSGSSGTTLCSGGLWGFGLPLSSTQLRYNLPATCSSTFFLNLSPLRKKKNQQFLVVCNYPTCEVLQYSTHRSGKLCSPILRISTPLPFSASPPPPPSHCCRSGQILTPSQECQTTYYRSFCGNHTKVL